jgi:hypothetical protein
MPLCCAGKSSMPIIIGPRFSPTISASRAIISAWLVVAIDGEVDCLQMKTGATRPCEGFTPPAKVAVGETKTHQIGIIQAVQVAVDWICVAGETLEDTEDIPADKSRDRTWLAVMKCKPDLAGKAPPPE